MKRAPWSEERIGILRELAADKLSAAEIGAKMGVTRNTISGAAHRHGIQLKGGTARKPDTPEAEAARLRKAVPSTRRAPAVPAPARVLAPPPELAPLPTSAALVPLPITFWDAVRADRCLFFACDPFSPDGPDMPVCGAERPAWAARENRYCARHLTLLAQKARAAA